MKISAGILAAGESKRFGEPKQLLKWKKSTILETVINEFKKVEFYRIYIVIGAYYKKILKKILKEISFCKILYNRNWKEGMFSSIKTLILNAINEDIDYLLIHQGDMPFIKKEILENFYNTAKKSKNRLIIGTTNGKPSHPYIISKEIFNEILKLDGYEGIRPIIRKYFENSIKIEVPYIIGKQDIDTWKDYWRLKNGIYMGKIN